MVSLSAPTFDVFGYMVSSNAVVIQQSTSRRSSRVATLDGGAELVEGGYSVADLVFEVQAQDPDGSHYEKIQWLIAYHSKAIMTCKQGAYIVLLSGLRSEQLQTFVRAEVLEELS